MHDCEMERVTFTIIVLCLGCCCCNGQEEECISNFAELENALLTNPENQYQIAMGYFPLKREISPVCVISYYYIGMNRSDVAKQDLENCHLYANKGEMITGCSKWKWCISSFYMGLNLAQLQDFSLYILFDETTELELELPPMCYMNDYEIHEYLLRLTMSLYHYARDFGKLGKGKEFIGYAARFLSTYDIEKLTLQSKPSSIDALSENENNSIDLYIFDTTILFISLLAFPMFATSFASFAYLLSIEELNGNEESADSPCARVEKKDTSNLQFMICSLVIICCIANGTMVFFQVSALQRNYEWFYLYPYVWLWIFIILKFFTSMNAVYMVKKRFLSSLPFWVEGTLLWILTMTMQLASWHLVFVLYGLVLNPLRALLYVLVMIVSLICSVVGLAVIMKFTVVLIFQYKRRFADINNTWLRRPNSLKKNRNKFPFIDVVLMFSLAMLLVYIFTFGAFMLQTSISSNSLSLDDLTKLIIPKAFLIAIAWLSTRLFLTPEKIWKLKTDA